jgi:hypothetical protein
MNTIFGNFLERTIPNLRDAIINLTIGGNSSVMNLEDFKAVMAPEPTPIPEPSYKVYTALVTQSGSDDPQSIFEGELTIGVTYRIENSGPPSGNWDFTNVGAPNNDFETSFIATGTTPNSWGVNIILVYNTGAPTVTVLQNTIGNIWFTYEAEGTYNVRSNSLFTIDKTYAPNILINSSPGILTVSTGNTSIIELVNNEGNGGMNNIPLEIRVYN